MVVSNHESFRIHLSSLTQRVHRIHWDDGCPNFYYVDHVRELNLSLWGISIISRESLLFTIEDKSVSGNLQYREPPRSGDNSSKWPFVVVTDLLQCRLLSWSSLSSESSSLSLRWVSTTEGHKYHCLSPRVILSARIRFLVTTGNYNYLLVFLVVPPFQPTDLNEYLNNPV